MRKRRYFDDDGGGVGIAGSLNTKGGIPRQPVTYRITVAGIINTRCSADGEAHQNLIWP